jgi:hypothetical protein
VAARGHAHRPETKGLPFATVYRNFVLPSADLQEVCAWKTNLGMKLIHTHVACFTFINERSRMAASRRDNRRTDRAEGI